ncbi:MAG: hypothetical protein NVS3B21_06690 [Acidimicrobiales bacterium]
MAPLEQYHEFLEELPHLLGFVTSDRDLVATHEDLGAPPEGGLDLTKELVTLAEKADHEMVTGDEDLDLGGCHGRYAGYPLNGN